MNLHKLCKLCGRNRLLSVIETWFDLRRCPCSASTSASAATASGRARKATATVVLLLLPTPKHRRISDRVERLPVIGSVYKKRVYAVD